MSTTSLTLPPTAPYYFAAPFVVNNPDGFWRRDSVPLAVRLADDTLKPWLQKVWKDMRSAVHEALTMTGEPIPKFMQWQPWQLCYEVAQLRAGRTPILAFAEDHIAGYLNVWRTQDTPPVLYIEHLCLSPGNLPTKLWRGRFVGLGMSLFAYAIHLSRENGLDERVGLHAADANVLNSVYRAYARAVPGLFKADATGIPGPTTYGPMKNMALTYLETTVAGAETFLGGIAMPDPTSTGFIPKWLRDQPLDEHEPSFLAGSIPDSDPRVVTRLVPKDHGYSLPARTVSRAIDLKQNLVYYAAFDVAEGPKPGFADLTAVPKALRDAATLVLEPAEPGSFVIPARLPDRKEFDADAVVARYAELLAAIDDSHKAAEVSIGALQVCRELGNLLRKDIESIDVTTYDRENAPRPTYKLTTASVQRLDKLLEGRRVTSRSTFETLTGKLEALDLGKNEFQLKLQGHSKRVKGTAAFFALSTLRERLGETVTLEGDVVRDARSVTMTAYRVVEGEDE